MTDTADDCACTNPTTLNLGAEVLPRIRILALRPNGIDTEECARVADAQVQIHKALPRTLRGCVALPPKIFRNEVGVEKVGDELAELVLSKLHYLGSVRQNSEHFGLFVLCRHGVRHLVALATVSPFDLHHLPPFVCADEKAVVLSRVYALPFAPRNSLSILLSRVQRDLIRNQKFDCILSYCDPNAGFSGAIYKASNWRLVATEPKSGFVFRDGRYVTVRELRREYGTAQFDALARLLPGRVERSSPQLTPMMLWKYSRPRKRRAAASGPWPHVALAL